MAQITYDCDSCGTTLSSGSDIKQLSGWAAHYDYMCKYCEHRLDNQNAAEKVANQ
jgi:DNA-directed RNA polymerase subunit RPC12/RpoP